MTKDQLGGVFRGIAAPLLAFAAGKGWIDAGDSDWIIAGVGSVVTAVWSMWTNRPARFQ